MSLFSTFEPGTLVWFYARMHIDGVCRKEHCQIAFVIRRSSKEDCIAHGFSGNDKSSYLILTGGNLCVISSVWLFPLDAFPLEDEQ